MKKRISGYCGHCSKEFASMSDLARHILSIKTWCECKKKKLLIVPDVTNEFYYGDMTYCLRCNNRIKPVLDA